MSMTGPWPHQWSEGEIRQLRALWADGVSTAEIGRRLGVPKSAVTNKARRLGLPGRPPPIRPKAPPKPGVPTLAELQGWRP